MARQPFTALTRLQGFMNYRTRDEFEGFEIRANYQFSDSDDHQDSEISALWGTGGEATRFVFALKHLIGRSWSSKTAT